jgi:hypothetical protein
MTIVQTNRKPGGVPIPEGLVLRQVLLSSGAVTVPSQIIPVFAIVIGAGGSPTGGNIGAGGAGGIVWGWTYAANTCTVGGANDGSDGGFSRYGHIIAGGGGTQGFPGILGSGGGGAATNSVSGAGVKNMFFGSNVAGVANTASLVATSGISGVGSSGGGYTTSTSSGATGGNGGNGLSGGGGSSTGIVSSGSSIGGNGGSGIVIIKLKSLSKTGKIPDEKSLNFSYDPVISFDPGKRAEYQAQLKTGVGGWRIVRFLPATSTAWYPINDNLTGTTLSGISYSYTNYWTVPFGTFDEFVFATLNMNYWLYCTKTTAYASYNNTAANIIKSSFSSTPYTALWYNRGGGNPEDPWISIQNHPTQLVYGENQAGSVSLVPLDGGMCVLVRDSTASTLVPSTTYTLNFPVPTLTNINTINNVILEGEYDITINNNSSSMTDKQRKEISKFSNNKMSRTMYDDDTFAEQYSEKIDGKRLYFNDIVKNNKII